MLVSTVRIEAGSPVTPFTNLHRHLHLRPLSRRQTGGGTADWRNHPAADGTTGRAAMTSAASAKLEDRLIVLCGQFAQQYDVLSVEFEEPQDRFLHLRNGITSNCSLGSPGCTRRRPCIQRRMTASDGSLVSWRRGTISTARATSPTRSILGSRKLPKRTSLRTPHSASGLALIFSTRARNPSSARCAVSRVTRCRAVAPARAWPSVANSYRSFPSMSGESTTRPSMVSSFRTAPALPWALGLLDPLSELLGVKHASDRRRGSRTLMIGTPAMVVFESICMPEIQKRSHPSSNISRTS